MKKSSMEDRVILVKHCTFLSGKAILTKFWQQVCQQKPGKFELI